MCLAECPLTLESERRQSEGFMRVNHAGEVSAQALYKAQALTARDNQVRDAMVRSAEEEIDHLVWCEERLHEFHDAMIERGQIKPIEKPRQPELIEN